MRDVNNTQQPLLAEQDVSGEAHSPEFAPAPGRARYKSLDIDECLTRFRLVRARNADLTERDRIMQYHHRSTANKHIRLRNLMASLDKENATPSEVLDFLEDAYGPGAHGYAVTIQAFPERAYLKKDPKWKGRVAGPMLLAANTKTRKKASPMHNEHVLKFLEVLTHETALIAFMWVSASRFGDLKDIVIMAKLELPHNLTGLALDYRGTKGDKSGKRGDAKAIVLPNRWLPFIEEHIRSERQQAPAKALMKEHRMYKVLRAVDPLLSLHSARNGALKALAKKVSAEDQAKQSLHGQQYRFELGALPVYLEGVWFQEERELKQLKMSLLMLESLNEVSSSARLEICQDWLTRQDSV